MPTNFPTGIASFGLPVLPTGSGGPPAPNAQPTLTSVGAGQAVTGNSNVYFVSSAIGSDGNTGKHMKTGGPLATLAQALKMVSPGDIVFLMPGHVENVIAANGIDIPVRALQIIGMGAGNQRPQIVFKTATTATFRVNTGNDGLYLYNVRVQTQIAAQVVAFNVIANDVTFDTVDFYDNGVADLQTFVQVTGLNCTVKNGTWQLSVANSAVLQWITLNAAHGFRCYNNFGHFQGLATLNPVNGVIVGLTALSRRVDISGNRFEIDNGGNASVVINLFAGTTGVVAYNSLVSTGKTASIGTLAPAACGCIQNFSSRSTAASGLLDPAVVVG